MLTRLAGARVLVTGGCGLIGSRIGRLLNRLGAVPVALDRLDAYQFEYANLFGAEDAYQEILRGDVADPAAVRRAMAGCDYVIHAAAYADVAACTANVAESTRTNLLGTQVVLDAVVRERPRRFVYVSSASVYGDGPNPGTAQRWNESTPIAPISVYANAKRWGECQTQLQLTGEVEHVSLRYFSVYGESQVPKPASHSWCVAWFGFHAALGLPLRLHHGGRPVRDFIHVDEVAEATVRALVATRAANQIINVGTGIATSVADVAAMVVQSFPDAELVHTPGPAGDPMGGCADVTLMERALEFRPTTRIADGVRRYMDWLGDSPTLALMEPVLVGGADVAGVGAGELR
ncbi:NAD-dependent epimerase/dehydratase family protein [Micromonospora sp. NPDC005652]|uniref:NAD-dependent epimerase/dehydratase family protein n=1 Tax=Micromonospora sp. NPDC005652 TaxID=3157046 RepID=UPI0034047EA5